MLNWSPIAVFEGWPAVVTPQRGGGVCFHHWRHHSHRAAGGGRECHEESRGHSYGDRHGEWHRWGGATQGVTRRHVSHLQGGWLQHAEQTCFLWALRPLDMLVRNCRAVEVMRWRRTSSFRENTHREETLWSLSLLDVRHWDGCIFCCCGERKIQQRK